MIDKVSCQPSWWHGTKSFLPTLLMIWYIHFSASPTEFPGSPLDNMVHTVFCQPSRWYGSYNSLPTLLVILYIKFSDNHLDDMVHKVFYQPSGWYGTYCVVVECLAKTFQCRSLDDVPYDYFCRLDLSYRESLIEKKTLMGVELYVVRHLMIASWLKPK